MAIHHIVLIKFIPGATAAQKEAWKSGITALSSQIPQIKHLVSGKKIPTPRDGGWDDGAIISFENAEDLKIYIDSKPHTDYVNATAEQTADKLIFDIEE